MKKIGCVASAIYIVIILLYLFGWGRCVYKATQCNWDPIGKAEIFYGVGSITSLGGVIGWFNIEDK